MYQTYKYYLPDGRRLAAFALEDEFEDFMNIVIIPCSKKDQFSKNKAQEIFNKILAFSDPDGKRPKCYSVSIPIEDNKPLRTFLRYMSKHYFKLFDSEVICKQKRLMGWETVIDIEAPRRVYKMGLRLNKPNYGAKID